MYFAALRPSEALGLRERDCHLPESGWGILTVEKSRPAAGRRYTDSGEVHDDRGLKHRGETEAREVPIPPELVAILRGMSSGSASTRTGGCSAVSGATSWRPRRTPVSGRRRGS